MEWLKHSDRTRELISKYRYVLVVLLAGLILMLVPHTQDAPQTTAPVSYENPENDLEEKLSQLLCQLEGAGKVKVLLTEAASEKYIYQTDESSDTTEKTGSLRRETVIVTDDQRKETGLVLQTVSPIYMGAVVLCQGANSAAVRLAVIEAVSNATGLASNQITVLKMK